jgi:hypothetical protein
VGVLKIAVLEIRDWLGDEKVRREENFRKLEKKPNYREVA